MFCVQCGKKIEDESRFCPYCGAEVVRIDRMKMLRAKRKKNI